MIMCIAIFLIMMRNLYMIISLIFHDTRKTFKTKTIANQHKYLRVSIESERTMYNLYGSYTTTISLFTPYIDKPNNRKEAKENSNLDFLKKFFVYWLSMCTPLSFSIWNFVVELLFVNL